MVAPQERKEVDTVQMATEGGNPPARRIPTPQVAYKLLEDLTNASEALAVMRAQLMAHMNGAPPYDPHEREEQGLAWTSNVNFREMRHIVRTEASAIWNMFMRVERFLDLQLADEAKVDVQLEHTEYAEIISEEFTRMLRDWESFEYETQFIINEMLSFGCGPFTFEDEFTWMPEAFQNAQLLVPLNAKSDLSKWEFCALKAEMKLIDLFDKLIEDPELAENAGWNLKALRTVIKRKAQGYTDDHEDFNTSEWEQLQKAIQNKEAGDEDYFVDVKVAHIFSQELKGENAGRITHQIIAVESEDENEFLFEDVGRFESWREVLGLFLYDIGDGYYRSVRGLAFHLYPTSDISNRITNDIMTALMLRSGLILKGRAGDDSQLLSMIKKGPITIIDSELEGAQQSFQPEIESLIAGRALTQNIQVNNTGALRSRDEGAPQTVQKSATQSSLEASKEAQFENNLAGWLYSMWTRYQTEILRRLLASDYPDHIAGFDERKLFLKRCRLRGVPARFLKFDVWKVRVTKAIGLGSPTQQLQLTSALVNMSSMFDEEGRRNALRDYLGTRFGYEAADRYVSRRNRNQILKTDHTLAHIENQLFLAGGRIPVGTDQFHVIHVPIHFQFLANLSKQGEAGEMDLKKLVPAFGTCLEHVFGHVQQLSVDRSRKALVEQYTEVLNIFAAQFKTLQRQLQRQLVKEQEEQQKREEQMQQLIGQGDREERLERLKIERDERLSQERVRAENSSKRDKTEAQIAAQDRKTDADIARKDRESASEQSRKAVSA